MRKPSYQLSRIRLVAGVLSALMLFGAFGVRAAADEWGSQDSNTGAHPDSNPHGFCYDASVTADLKSGIQEAEWDALNPTHATVTFDSSCQFTGSGETDVVWFELELPGLDGKAPCEDYDNGRCDQYYAQIDDDVNGELDESQTACHELGHTVGLSHGSWDCMAGDPPNSQTKWRRYGTHHTDHINGWF